MQRRFGLKSADAARYGVYFFVPCDGCDGKETWSRILIRFDDTRSLSSLIVIGADPSRLVLSFEGVRDVRFDYYQFDRGGVRLLDVAWAARLMPLESAYLVWMFQWWSGSKAPWPRSVVMFTHQVEQLLSSFYRLTTTEHE